MRHQLSLNISVGRACFVRCEGCYNHFGKSDELTPTSDILRFLTFARSMGITRVTLCGGDPLSRPDIMRLLTEVKALGFTISLDTVGTPLLGPTQTMFFGAHRVAGVDPRRLAELVDLIGIPLDGATDEGIRTFRTGRPAIHGEQLTILGRLQSAGATVCVNTVAHAGNLAEIPTLPDTIQAYDCIVGWQVFQFTPSGPLGYRNRARFEIDAEVFARLARETLHRAEQVDLSCQVEFKSVAERVGNYMLIDSEGLAWMPACDVAAGEGQPSGEGAGRVVLGDIRNPEHHSLIIRAVLDPSRRVGGAYQLETSIP